MLNLKRQKGLHICSQLAWLCAVLPRALAFFVCPELVLEKVLLLCYLVLLQPYIGSAHTAYVDDCKSHACLCDSLSVE